MGMIVPELHTITHRYQLNRKLFSLFLDPTLSWSCAWFEQDDMDLEAAQLAKYRRLCTQLKLTRQDHVLELGSGWGSNSIYMSLNYGCRVITLAQNDEQYQFVTRRVLSAGLEGRIA